jgi:hypothetical protein
MQNVALTGDRLAKALRKLAAAGCPVDESVADATDQSRDLEINQVGESMAYELADGRTAYIFELEFINQTAKNIYLSETPTVSGHGEDPELEWLPAPKETSQEFSRSRKKRDRQSEREHLRSQPYCFPGGSKLEYPRDVVLNHILFPKLLLPPSCPLRGLLLGIGRGMPKELRHGEIIEQTISLISTKHNEYSASIRLMVDRMEAKERPERKSSIYDDPIIEPSARIPSKRAEDFGVAIAAHKDPKPAPGQDCL